MGNNGLEIQEASNGFIVLERARLGTNMFGEGCTHVFKTSEELIAFVKEHFAQKLPGLDMEEQALIKGKEAAANSQRINVPYVG